MDTLADLPGSAPSSAAALVAMIDSVRAHVHVKDRDGCFLYANAAVRAFYGVTLEELVGAPVGRFVDLEQSPRLLANDNVVLETGESLHDEEELVLHSGVRRSFWTTKVPFHDAAGRVVAVCGISTDAARSRASVQHLIGHNRLLDVLLANIDAYIYLKDYQGRYLYANCKVLRLYGRAAEDVVGRTDVQIHGPEVAASLVEADRRVLASGKRQAMQEVITDGDGREHHYWSIKLPLEQPGQPSCLLGFSTEITELLHLQQNLERQRTTDALTGLPNHVQFVEGLALELRMAECSGQPLAVALLDLDEFKYVNTHLGQEGGNQVLRETAHRLRQLVPVACNLARLGGDGFAVAFPRVRDADEALCMVQALRDCLAVPFQVLGKPVRVSASAGLAMYPEHGVNADALLGNAEVAMYAAKAGGRDRQCAWARALSAAAVLRVEMEADLRGALAAGQFELHYQPKVSAGDGHVAGLEALLRWNRPGHGQVPPMEFIPMAERLDLLPQIGAWVVDEACRVMAQWRQAGLGQVSVAVNLSPSQLGSGDLLDGVRQSMQRHGVSPGELEMEVTESMMMNDPEQAIALLQGLADAGVHLSIDDFGTGYSSMAYLKLLPVGTLKLDRHFVKEIDSDPRDADVCAGIIALAHKLGLRVVAEGVETVAQQRALAERDCDFFQGFLFGRPMPEDAVADCLRRLSVSSVRSPQGLAG